MSDSLLFWAAVALGGVALSALYSGMETGCYCASRIRLAAQASQRRGGARLLLRELHQLDRALATLLIGNNAANYIGTLGVAALLERLGYASWEGVAINALLLTPVLFVFGETIPKDLFRAQADRLTPALAWTLPLTRFVATVTLTLPVVRWAGGALSRALGGGVAPPTARAGLAALVKEGARFGVLAESQLRFVDRALELRSLRVRDEMIPWRDVVKLVDSWPRSRVEQVVREAGYSRFPLLDGGRRLLGVVEAFDIWLSPDTPLAQLARKATLLEADAPLVEAVAAVQEAGADLCVVVHRARPVGVVTRKDLAEPVLGEIQAW